MVAAVSAPVEIPEGYLDGPWSKDVEPVGYGGEDGYCIRDYRGLVLAVTIGDVPELRDTEAANAALIALAPEMAAELLALRAEVARLTATLEAEREGSKVKPLVWALHDGDATCIDRWTAPGIGGFYTIEARRHGGFYDIWEPNADSGARCGSRDEAVGKAQKHFDAAILAALAPQAES